MKERRRVDTARARARDLLPFPLWLPRAVLQSYKFWEAQQRAWNLVRKDVRVGGGFFFVRSWDTVAGGTSNRAHFSLYSLHAGGRWSSLVRRLRLLCRPLHRTEGGHAREVPFRFDVGEPESRDGRLVDHFGSAGELGRGEAHHCRWWWRYKVGGGGVREEVREDQGEKNETHRHGPFLVASLDHRFRESRDPSWPCWRRRTEVRTAAGEGGGGGTDLTPCRHAQNSKVPLPLPIRVSLPCVECTRSVGSVVGPSGLRERTLMQTGMSGKTRMYL